MGKLLWRPSPERIERTRMNRFMEVVNGRFSLSLDGYEALYQWSIRHIPEFWAVFWDFADIRHSAAYEQVIDDPEKMPGARWFPGARLNFAQNLLRYRDERPALIFKGEGRPATRMSYAALHDEVARLARAMRACGVRAGDRIAGFMPNMPQTIIAMLASASIGALWSSCSPDFGIKGVLDRFGQIRPKLLFTADGYAYKGKKIDCIGPISAVLRELQGIERVVVVPYEGDMGKIGTIPRATAYPDFISSEPGLDIDFAQLPFAHPLYIMYSSGTTGLPKCMVQSAGGILLQHMKELMLHTDVGRKDTIFYFTTCGWMMWNWLTSALSLGAAVVLYDGNPFYPNPGALWEMAQDEGVSVFGTSAGYIAALKKSGLRPGDTYDLSPLRAVLSTGSPLSEAGFEFVYEAVKKNLQLASISGGTDLNSCFALGNPTGPVYAGELQCRGLAMKVEAFDDRGAPVMNRQGELVCLAPFPSMPIHFWNDPDGVKYHQAYFDAYPHAWRHGDYIEINDHGGVVIHGRSDATLNPGGVRIGTAEIYRLMEGFEEIADSVAVAQPWKGDERVILFIKTASGHHLDGALKRRIAKAIGTHISPRHVPSKILPTPDIPYTLNMKKVELAVRRTIMGQPVQNRDALMNPEALDHFRNLKELQRD
jgi:acetoacetyl-CoA synthetase